MPYASKKQQAWAHTDSGMKALGGAAKVHEWDEATKSKPGGFKGLPTRVPKRAGDSPGMNRTMRPSMAPASFMKPAKPVFPLKMGPMAKPKGVKGLQPKVPSGTRSMSSGAAKPFGSFAPQRMPNAFDGSLDE